MKTRNSQYTKQQMAEHNGVDTSKWGNDCPRISVSEAWQDHQATQQLVRLYLNNSNSTYIFNRRGVVIFVNSSDYEAIHSYTPVTKACLNMTCLGTCLDVHTAKNISDIDNDIVYGDWCKKVNPFIFKAIIIPSTDDMKNVIINGKTYPREAIEELAKNDEYFFPQYFCKCSFANIENALNKKD